MGDSFAVLEEKTMRWIILALSLGAFVMSMIHSVFVLFGFFPVSAGALPALPAWMVGGLTIVSAVLAQIGRAHV